MVINVSSVTPKGIPHDRISLFSPLFHYVIEAPFIQGPFRVVEVSMFVR